MWKKDSLTSYCFDLFSEENPPGPWKTRKQRFILSLDFICNASPLFSTVIWSTVFTKMSVPGPLLGMVGGTLVTIASIVYNATREDWGATLPA